MVEPFLPYLTLDQIYVSPIVQQEDGSYKCLTYQEMQQVAIPATGSKLMDAVAHAMAIKPFQRSSDIAEYLQVDTRMLSGAVFLNCGQMLKNLLYDYRSRMICEIIQYTQLTPEEVAERCGLSDASIVNHVLKTKFKTTFYSYRSKYQKKATKKVVIYK